MKSFEPTHFNALYNVPYKSMRTGEYYIDHCDSGVREIKYLEPFLKSVGAQVVAIIKIMQKKKD